MTFKKSLRLQQISPAPCLFYHEGSTYLPSPVVVHGPELSAIPATRLKARGLDGGPSGWLEESYPAGCDFVYDGRSMPPSLTDHTTCPGLGLPSCERLTFFFSFLKVWWHKPFFFIFIIFINHSHNPIIHSFILHHSPSPVFLYPHRFFAQQEKNLYGVPRRLGPTLQQAEAIPTELRHSLKLCRSL